MKPSRGSGEPELDTGSESEAVSAGMPSDMLEAAIMDGNMEGAAYEAFRRASRRL